MTHVGGFDVDASGRSYYVPSSFYIYVAPGVLDAEGASLAGGWYRLMHEYGHLLQDRASLFGVIEFLHFFDSFQSVVLLLTAAGVEVRLPLREAAGADKAWLTSIESLRSIVYPRTAWRNDVWWAYERHRVADVPVFYEGELRPIPVAIAHFVDNKSGDTYEHEIGPREIKEAYSVAIQVLHGGPSVDEPDQFEYVAIERILGRAGAVDERQMIAICHWALQDSVPGVRFFEIVSLLEAEGLRPADELYDRLREDAMKRGAADKVDTAARQLNEIIDNQRKSGEGDLLYQVLGWYRDRAIAALRRNLDPARRFPLDTYVGTRSAAPNPEQFASMVSEEPIPLVQNANDGAFAFGGQSVDSDTVLFVRALADLVSRLWSNGVAGWSCPLVASCTLHLKDEACEQTPWTKSLAERPCPYGAAARYLGLPNTHRLLAKAAPA